MHPALNIVTQLQTWGCTSGYSSLQVYDRRQHSTLCMKALLQCHGYIPV